MKRIVVTVLSCLLLTTALLAEGIAEDAAMLAPVTEKSDVTFAACLWGNILHGCLSCSCLTIGW